MPSKRRSLKKSKTIDALIEKLEKIKACIRAKVEHTLQGDQMPVWMSQDSLSGLGQKLGKTICVEQLVDGEKTNYSGACIISASAACEIGQEKAQSGHSTGVKSLKWVKQKNIISSGEFLSINSRFCGSYSELP